MTTRYPAPNRSSFKTNEHRDDPDLPEGDLGAYDAAFADGRPYRVETWFTGGHTLITCFFSVLNLEAASAAELLELVGPVLTETEVPAEHRRLTAESIRTIEDGSKNRMYSLTFVLGTPSL